MNHVQWTPHVVLAVLIGAALYVAGVPVLGFLPVLVLLACPLMMIFMMRNMAGHEPRDRGGAEARDGIPPADTQGSRQQP